MNKKRVLFVHHGVGIGGAPHSLLLLVQSLDRVKYEPTVLFLFESPAIDLFREAGIPVLGSVGRVDFAHTQIWWYRWYHVSHIFRALWDWLMVWLFDAAFWINKAKPDIIHLNTSSLSAWAVRARSMGIPVVWHIRESLAPGYLGIRRALTRFLVGRYATKILAITTFDGRFWRGNPKLEILYNAVDCSVFIPSDMTRNEWRTHHNIPKNDKVLLYVGGLSREKGALQALRLLKEMRRRGHEDVWLVIANSWKFPEPSFLKKLFGVQRWYDRVKKLQDELSDRLVFVGALPSVLAEIQASDCLLFPATVGHNARPVIEAGAVGIPSIASDLPPLDELVIEGKTGFLCSAGDSVAWASRCEEVLFSPKRQQEIGAHASEFVRKFFSLAQYRQRVVRLYKTL